MDILFTLDGLTLEKKWNGYYKGCSAQDIYEKTYLTEIGAYNYLIYLKEDPEQALKDLKNGLPIK